MFCTFFMMNITNFLLIKIENILHGIRGLKFLHGIADVFTSRSRLHYIIYNNTRDLNSVRCAP